MADTDTICWILSDGRKGMENQCLGLAERVAAEIGGMKIVSKHLHPRAPWKWLPESVFGRPWPLPFWSLNGESDSLGAPWPDLVVACGRKTVAFAAAIKRLSADQTFVVQTQDPRLSSRFFDLVVPPAHDKLTGPNVLSLLGSPNRITAQKLRDGLVEMGSAFDALPEQKIAVLIGGTSRHYTLDDEVMKAIINDLQSLQAEGYGLMITTSRRTGKNHEQALRENLVGTNVFIWDESGPNPYFAMLEHASHILVTGESTNMVTEAATTGKPVYILPLKGGSAKFEHLHKALAEAGITRTFTGKLESWDYQPLDETGRAAAVIIEQMRSRSMIRTDF